MVWFWWVVIYPTGLGVLKLARSIEVVNLSDGFLAHDALDQLGAVDALAVGEVGDDLPAAIGEIQAAATLQLSPVGGAADVGTGLDDVVDAVWQRFVAIALTLPTSGQFWTAWQMHSHRTASVVPAMRASSGKSCRRRSPCTFLLVSRGLMVGEEVASSSSWLNQSML